MIKSILTPTRNRPNNCERFIRSVYNATTSKQNVEMLFYADNDEFLTHGDVQKFIDNPVIPKGVMDLIDTKIAK